MYFLRSVKIAFWNCRGALRKKGDIEKLAEAVDILFLAETCVSSLRDFRVMGYDCLRIDANQADVRGMLVLIRNPIMILLRNNTFMELISRRYEGFSPFKPHPSSKSSRAAFTKKGPPPSPWWTPECSAAVDQRREALKVFRHNPLSPLPSRGNYVFYRSVVTQTRKTLRKAKCSGWKMFCGSLDMKTLTAHIWRMLKRFRNHRLISANSSAHNRNEDRSVMIQEAIAKLCPPFVPPSPPIISEAYTGVHAWLDDPFTLDELSAALQSVKSSSSPGLDRIDYRLVKALPFELKHTLFKIFNNLYRCSTFPSQRSHSLIHLLPKARRFLGVLLDPTLSGKAHMTAVIDKVNIIRALRGTWWGAHPHLLLNIYRFMLRASIEYAAQIFGMNHNPCSRALQVIQNQALRLCFGYRISTPLNVIYAETVELTLSFRFRLLTSRYFIKISSVHGHITVEKLHLLCDTARAISRMDYLHKHFPAANLFLHIWYYYHSFVDRSYTLLFFRSSFRSTSITISYSSLSLPPADITQSISSPSAQSFFEQEFQHLIYDSTTFFTDGSKSDHSTHVGAAVFSPQLQAELMYKLLSYTSIFSAEAYAIYNAVIISIDLNLQNVTIVSDSKSVLQALSGHRNPTNNYLIPLIKSVLEKAQLNGTNI
ncbi:hypothetical protein ALC62_12362 [Cyphomyrmex costatus]|uniref:RNase H type-1 domain-containing protein n=1 Tax=Cyphomyrmex costatus TaxID=456900 RepID=A0A151IBF5_9HYME|nr:hypothetical protein ALC62_12362 [Cyphomyrmex costatus]